MAPDRPDWISLKIWHVTNNKTQANEISHFRCQHVIPPPECTEGQKQMIATDDFCGLIKNKMGPFKECIEAAMGSDFISEIYFECEYDVCANHPNRTAMVEVACDALTKLEEECGIDYQIIDIDWRTPSFCPRKFISVGLALLKIKVTG